MTWLHLLLHWLAIHSGSENESSGYYGFFSGIGSDLGEVAIIGAVIEMYRKHNCHVKGCWRVARHPVEGTTFVVCRHHHPDDTPSHQDVLDAHKEAKHK